jgi:hypothetical protein
MYLFGDWVVVSLKTSNIPLLENGGVAVRSKKRREATLFRTVGVVFWAKYSGLLVSPV